LGRLAAWHRSRFSVPVVAITGSIGKTTVKELTAAVLATRGEVLKPASSFNNQWGLPLTLLRLGPDHRAAVVELGTNQAGEIATLSAIAQPTVGVVTMVAAVHTEFLGSIEGVREEKAALVRALSPSGIAVLNADDARVASMARETKGRVITFGRAAGAAGRRPRRVEACGRGDDPRRHVQRQPGLGARRARHAGGTTRGSARGGGAGRHARARRAQRRRAP